MTVNRKGLSVDQDILNQLEAIFNLLQGDSNGETNVNVTDRAARDLGKVDVAGIDTVGSIAGQKAMAASIPVVVASDQSNMSVSQTTHDSLNLNANIQVNNADAANANPVPVSDAGGAISIDVGGVTPGLDNTNELKVSLYGKNSAAGDTPVAADSDGRLRIVDSLKKTAIGTDQTITFANSDPANTQKTNTVTMPTTRSLGEYEFIVYNPSTVTDLTVKVFSVQAALGGGSRDSLITTLSIPKSQSLTGTTVNTYSRYLHGIFNGTDCKFVFSNDTALGGSDGFSAYFRLNEVK